MTPIPLDVSQALRCPPARGWRRSRPDVPPNMAARMAADEARAWNHSQSAGILWESGWRLSRAMSSAKEIENNCCNDSKNHADSPRRHAGGAAPAGCREPLEETKMKTNTAPSTINQALAGLNQSLELHELPDSEFCFGGSIDDACRLAGYLESGRIVVNQANAWNMTVAAFCDFLQPAPAGCREPLGNTKMTTIRINEINSAGLKAQGKIDGITEVELIGTNGKTGDEKFTAYWFGGVRVIDTNGDPVWEEQDPEAFAEMMAEIEGQ